MTTYYLRIGPNQLLDGSLDGDLSSGDVDRVNRANQVIKDRLKEVRVRIGTLLKTDNVSFLLGSGASMGAGGVGLATIPLALERMLHERKTDDVDWSEEYLEFFYGSLSFLLDERFELQVRTDALTNAREPAQAIPMNLEEYLSQLHAWCSGMLDGDANATLKKGSNSLEVRRDICERLIRAINIGLTRLLDLPAPESKDGIEGHRRLIRKVLTRPLNLRRVNLFTLNYDTLIEQAADAEGAVLVDGFAGTLRRVFRPESYDLDFYFPAQTTEGRVHRFDRALHLYKLHGSLAWRRCTEGWDNPYGLYATFVNPRTANDVVIYPSPQKYGNALGMPYSELFRRFAAATAQAQSVLFVIGYSFGDAHVNALIRQALAIPSFILVIVDPEPKNTFVRHLEEQADERVWLIHGWELGTFRAFVDKLLPDLRDEEILRKVIATYQALALGMGDKTPSSLPEEEPS